MNNRNTLVFIDQGPNSLLEFELELTMQPPTLFLYRNYGTQSECRKRNKDKRLINE